MTEIDRTGWDPFAPAPVKPARPDAAKTERAEVVEETQPAEQAEPEKAGASLPANLDTLSHADLVELAESHGIPSYGTKAQIAQRLRDRVK